MVWLHPLFNQRPHHITNTSKDQNWPLSKEERKTPPLSRLIYCFQSIRWPASPLYSSQSVCLSVWLNPPLIPITALSYYNSVHHT